jgi:hypothetical protein
MGLGLLVVGLRAMQMMVCPLVKIGEPMNLKQAMDHQNEGVKGWLK